MTSMTDRAEIDRLIINSRYEEPTHSKGARIGKAEIAKRLAGER